MVEDACGKRQRKRFLSAACNKLGFCLSQQVRENLSDQSDLSPKNFVRAVIEAEGIEPIHLESYEHFKPLMDLYQKFVFEV